MTQDYNYVLHEERKGKKIINEICEAYEESGISKIENRRRNAANKRSVKN